MDNNYNQQSNPYMDNGYGNSGSSYNYGSAPEPQEAPNIFQQFVLAFVPPQYSRLTKVKTGSMIGFVTLLTLIATILSAISLVISFSSIGGKNWMDALPDFEVDGGRLYIEEDFLYDQSGAYIYLTDDIDGFSYDDASALARQGYRNIILAGRDRLSVMQNGEYQQIDFKNLGSDVEISKDWIVEIIMPVMVVVIILAYIIFFVGRTLWYFLCAAVYSLIAQLISMIMKKLQPSDVLFRTAVYSKVLMFVVALLLELIPFVSISIPGILRIAITIAFMGFVIAKLPDRD